METRAVAKFLRISPRKTRRIAREIQGKQLDEALQFLRLLPHRSARMLEKAVMSAAANAENNRNMDRDRLRIASAVVDGGPTLKRFLPRARGRADRILKRTSHVTIVVNDQAGGTD